MPNGFDVFLSHNSQDKPIVEEVGVYLRERGLQVWLDKWELRPGFPWQEELEEGIRSSRAVAVFVGAVGLGSWQEPEMRAFIARSRREKVPVIPVLLPGCPASPQLNFFLEALTWVDLREGLSDDGLTRLIWGITGLKNEGLEVVTAVPTGTNKQSTPLKDPRLPKIWVSSGIGFVLLALAMALVAWLWPSSHETPPKPTQPAIYAVRLQVLDPYSRPVRGSTVKASTGNEPQRTPDGWWEVEIPAAKVPADGKVSLYVEHEAWEGARVDLDLREDPNPQAEIRLREPQTWIRGQVVDDSNQPLPSVRVTRQDGASGETSTDAKGHFALRLSVPGDTRVRLRAEHENWASGDSFCYAGRDSCLIVLAKR